MEEVRGVCVCAVLRGVTFTEANYTSFIDQQDKLHHNLGRKRALVSFGTHDLDAIQGPFTYEALPPEKIKFAALNKSEQTDANQLFAELSHDLHLKPYLKLLEGKPLYPVITDSNGAVLSLPPIINGDQSKLSLATKNVFIEVTATDLTKAQLGLKNLVCAFSTYCSTKFEIEQVEVVYESGKSAVAPNLTPQTVKCNLPYMLKLAGFETDAKTALSLLGKMGFKKITGDDQDFELEVPITRGDVMHQCDVAEDLAIAYGYNNIAPELPPVSTIGKQQPLNKLTEMVRLEMATAGYKECLNFALCNLKENTSNLNLPSDLPQVTIANSKTIDFQAGRSNLLSGLLKTLVSNKKNKLPIELFEASDVVTFADNEVGVKNQRRLSAIRTNIKSSELSLTHGMLDLIMAKLKVKSDPLTGYTLRKGTSPTYFKDLQADVYYKNHLIGHMGILHPQVLENIQWPYPISVFEVNLEPIFNDFFVV